MRRGMSATAHEAFLDRVRRDLDVTSETGIPLAVRKRLEREGQWEAVGVRTEEQGAPPVRLAAGALGGALRGRWAAQRFVRHAALVRRHGRSHSQVGTCG